ncbi:hypothetical protein BX666DRAFT_1947479 [Dichotomocladium elegans]|nr:hypothetical protein BX666DRAFT_1947479 [Dichotomocladium elegans]
MYSGYIDSHFRPKHVLRTYIQGRMLIDNDDAYKRSGDQAQLHSVHGPRQGQIFQADV